MGVVEGRFREAEGRMWASVGVTPTERTLELGRTRVTVRVQEVGDGPTIVLVHGASNSGVSWASLVARLDGYRCVIVDRPGCGLSPALATSFDDVGRLAAFADALVADVLDALGQDTAHVIGTSFGGYFSLRAALAHRERIDRMVLLGWTVGAPIGKTPFVMRLASAPLVGRLMLAVPPNERMVRSIFKGIGLKQALAAGRVPQEMVDCFLSMLRDTDTMRNELAAGPKILTPLRGMNDSLLLSADELTKIDRPIHWLWGEEDPIGGGDIARAFTPQLPNCELEIMPGVGHAPWIDDPDHVAKATRAFFERRTR